MKLKTKSILLCRVCGDIARGVNFSAITCMSCKMFFRRHAQTQLVRNDNIKFFEIFSFSLNHLDKATMSF